MITVEHDCTRKQQKQSNVVGLVPAFRMATLGKPKYY